MCCCCCHTGGGEWAAYYMKDDSGVYSDSKPHILLEDATPTGYPEVPLEQNEVPRACTHVCTHTHLDTECL